MSTAKTPPSPERNSITIVNGGSTCPSIQLTQQENGRCHLYWFAYDQGTADWGTIDEFDDHDWVRAQARAKRSLIEEL